MGSTFSSSREGPQPAGALRVRQRNVSAMRGEIKALRECLVKRHEKLVCAVSGIGDGFTRISEWMARVERPGLGCAPCLGERSSEPHAMGADLAAAGATGALAARRSEAASAFGKDGEEGAASAAAVEAALGALDALEGVTWRGVGKLGAAAEKAFAAYRKQYLKVKEWRWKQEKAQAKAKRAGTAAPREGEAKVSTHLCEEARRLREYEDALRAFDEAYEGALGESVRVGRETAAMWETRVAAYLHRFVEELGGACPGESQKRSGGVAPDAGEKRVGLSPTAQAH